MANTGTWFDNYGMVRRFAGYYRDKIRNRARIVKSFGLTKELEYDFDLVKIPAGTISYTSDLTNSGSVTGFSLGDVALPANSRVTKVTLVMQEAAAGGTSITFGTFAQDGTAIDADGLITATVGVLANLDSVGETVIGDGAQVVFTSNTGVSIGTAPAFLAITTAGTFTAGKGRIKVEYTTAPAITSLTN